MNAWRYFINLSARKFILTNLLFVNIIIKDVPV